MTELVWFAPEGAWSCSRCPADIDSAHPAAWLRDGDDGEVLCVDCADNALAHMDEQTAADAVGPTIH